jgi:hypothetical protein
MFFFGKKKNEKAGNRSYNFPNNTEVNKILSVGYQTQR